MASAAGRILQIAARKSQGELGSRSELGQLLATALFGGDLWTCWRQCVSASLKSRESQKKPRRLGRGQLSEQAHRGMGALARLGFTSRQKPKRSVEQCGQMNELAEAGPGCRSRGASCAGDFVERTTAKTKQRTCQGDGLRQVEWRRPSGRQPSSTSSAAAQALLVFRGGQVVR